MSELDVIYMFPYLSRSSAVDIFFGGPKGTRPVWAMVCHTKYERGLFRFGKEQEPYVDVPYQEVYVPYRQVDMCSMRYDTVIL